MSDEAGRKPQEFKKVEDPNEAKILLREGAKTTSAAMIWTKDQGAVINSNITNYSATELAIYVRRPADLDVASFTGEVARNGGACFFSVSLPRANIFFRAKFLGDDLAGLKFEIPADVFTVQRRREVRLPIPSDYTIKVDFDDPLFANQTLTKKIADISAMGMAFIADADESSLFQPGLKLKNMAFTIKGRRIVAEGEVRHAKALASRATGKPSLKVGILFTNIRPGESQLIANYIFEETRKFYTKFM